jgi:small GTP-binding protein
MSAHRCGTIAIAGRPNTGKSSLLNRLVGEKLSIVSSRAQTTRHLVTGILTTEDCQYVFTDAPGFQREHRNAMHRMLNRRARRTSPCSSSKRCASAKRTVRRSRSYRPRAESWP